MPHIDNNDISIILTVYNKQEIIGRVFTGIINNISKNVREIIIVLDGCNDNSFNEINKIKLEKNVNIEFLYTPNINETLANNCGLRKSSGEYSIIVQDDCEILEKDFDKRLLKPFLKFENVLAVSGRDSEDICFVNGQIKHYNMAGADVNTPRNIFAVRDSINRGPLMIKNEKMEKLNYFDEIFSPLWGDDIDLSLRAYKNFNFIVGSYRIKFYSPLEWGATRNIGGRKIFSISNLKNKKILFERYKDYLENTSKHSRDIIL